MVQWGTLSCALLLFWAFVVAPYGQWRSQQSEKIAQNMDRIARMEALIDHGAELNSQFANAREQEEKLQQKLINARTHSRAISQQVEVFEKYYRRHGLTFTSRRFGEPSLTPWLGENVDAQWRVTGTTSQILNVLYELAQAPTIVAPTFLSIKPAARKRNKEQNYELAIDLRSYRSLPMRDLKARSKQEQP
jgi:hypothetical protein